MSASAVVSDSLIARGASIDARVSGSRRSARTCGANGAASPASADVNCGTKRTASKYDGFFVTYRAEVDNKPGDGAPSWIWVESPDADHPAHVDFFLEGDSSMHRFSVIGFSSGATEPARNITQFRVCGVDAPGTGDVCSAWHHLTLG